MRQIYESDFWHHETMTVTFAIMTSPSSFVIHRSSSIGAVFSRIKKRQLLFPRVQQSGTFLDEFTCEQAVYDDEMKSIRFTKPDNLRDDALHATNYAQLLALRMYSANPG